MLNVDGLAIDRLGQGESSVRLVGGVDDRSEVTLLADTAGTTSGLVEASG